jgi:hypothetical protein
MEIFVDSNTADRQLQRFFNDTDRGMTASAQRAARLFAQGFTRGIDGVIRDSHGRIIDPNDPRLQINSQRAGRRFWSNFHNQSQQAMGAMFRSTGFLSMFSNLPPQFQAAIAAGLVTAVVGAASAVGAALNAVILAAVGGGVLAAGIVSAVQNPMVSKAFGDVGHEFQNIFKDMGTPFVEPLMRAADRFQERVIKLRPEFRDMALEISDLVDPLADGLDGLVKEVMPGLREAVTASMPVLREFFKDLPEIGKALSDFFHSMSTEGEGAVKGMRALMMLLAGAITTVGDVIEFLSGEWDDFTERVENGLQGLSKIPLIGRLFQDAADDWEQFNETGDGFVRTIGGVAEGLDRTAESSERARVEAQKLDKQMDQLFQTMTGSRDAAIAYEQAIDDLTESLKQNGLTTDIGTQKGRDNAKAIDDVAKAAYRTREAMIAQAGGQNASAQAVQSANDAYRRQIDALRAQLLAAGMSKQQVDALLQSWYALVNAPNTVKHVTIKYSAQGSSISPGRYRFERWGGVEHAQMGTLSRAQVFRGGPTLFAFAEPETEQEAFIPKRGDQRRSMAILRIAADWMNADVLPRPSGPSPLPAGRAGTIGTRHIAGMHTERAAHKLGPYTIQVGDRVLTSFVVDAITGAPEAIADAADEGRRRRRFLNPQISR